VRGDLREIGGKQEIVFFIVKSICQITTSALNSLGNYAVRRSNIKPFI
jgi:hypothetical protein